MYSKDDMFSLLNKEVDELENKINNPDSYNQKCSIARKLINAGIALDYALPILLVTATLYQGSALLGKRPFVIDDVIVPANEMVVDSSNGHHFSKEAPYYFENSVKYSTGWSINEFGLYEREETEYVLNNVIDIKDLDYLFSLNSQELNDVFMPLPTEIITKENLNDEDYIYNEPGIFVTRVENTGKYYYAPETKASNIADSICFILAAFMISGVLVNQITVKGKIRKHLEKEKIYYKQIKDYELEELKKVLEVKKNNLKLVEGDYQHVR